MDKDLKQNFVNFSGIGIDTILYVKLSYTDEQNNIQEIRTTVASCSNTYMFLRLNQIGKMNINCPQQAKIKIVTRETLYKGDVKLSEIIYHSDWISFAIEKPPRLERVQEREYYRIRTPDKKATIYYTSSNGQTGELNATIFDIAIKSIKVYDLQLPNGEPLSSFLFDNMKNIQIKIKMESLLNVTFPSLFLRHRVQDDVDMYIFLFHKTNTKDEALLSKALTDIQRAQLQKKNIDE